MRIALVDPSYRRDGRLIRLKRIGYPALTLPALAAAIPDGHDVRFVYEKCEPVPLGERFDLVLFTTMGPNLPRAFELSERFRDQGALTAVGGWTAMEYADLCRDRFDSIVLGEAEGALEHLVEDAARGRLAPRYESWTPDLRRLRRPRYELDRPAFLGPIIPVEASRGCRNACTFCAVSTFTRHRLRTLAVEQVVENVVFARRTLGRSAFYFTDPNFAQDRAHAMAVMEALVPLGIEWLASVDIGALADDAFLSLARRSGCFTLQVGFETLDPAALRASAKGFADPAGYGAAIARAHGHGIPITALMMVGFDTDTLATFGDIERFVEDHHLPLLVLHVLTPIRGTAYFRKVAAEGRMLGDPLHEGDGMKLFVEPRHMTPAQFDRQFRHLMDRVYSLPSIARRFFHAGALRNVRANVILALTNLLGARRSYLRGLPPGMYE